VVSHTGAYRARRLDWRHLAKQEAIWGRLASKPLGLHDGVRVEVRSVAVLCWEQVCMAASGRERVSAGLRDGWSRRNCSSMFGGLAVWAGGLERSVLVLRGEASRLPPAFRGLTFLISLLVAVISNGDCSNVQATPPPFFTAPQVSNSAVLLLHAALTPSARALAAGHIRLNARARRVGPSIVFLPLRRDSADRSQSSITAYRSCFKPLAGQRSLLSPPPRLDDRLASSTPRSSGCPAPWSGLRRHSPSCYS